MYYQSYCYFEYLMHLRETGEEYDSSDRHEQRLCKGCHTVLEIVKSLSSCCSYVEAWRWPFPAKQFGNSGKWFRSFPKTFREISEMRTIQPQILEIPGAK